MVQLGVFLIPASQHPFYRVASSALGYDIWTQRHTTSTLSGLFDQDSLVRCLAWTPRFGVHCTLTGTALHFEDADRSEIVERLAWIAGRTAPFNLVCGRIDATYRGYPKQLVVTFDSPDGALQRLHRLVVTLISPLYVRSNYAPRLPHLTGRPRELYQRYGEPWVLEQYAPHWSLLDDLPDTTVWAAARDLLMQIGLFADESTRTMLVDAVHLVERVDDEFCTVTASFPLTGRPRLQESETGLPAQRS